jgi:YARHG domain/WG containing repeat
MKKSTIALLLFLTIAAIQSCSIFKKNDPEKNVRAFLKQFEDNLQKSDEIILSQFQVDKSKEVILKAIRILQNKEKDMDSVRSEVNFSLATVFFEDKDIRVEVQGEYTSMDVSNLFEQETKFAMWLAPSNTNEFKIIKFEANDFYQGYQEMIWQVKEKAAREREIASKQIYFNQARKLRQTYDSVIWVSHYQDSIYYYVVNGKWKNYFLNRNEIKLDSVKMGLVSETGRVIVPPDYDLVGTIGFETDGVMEVKKNNKVGLFAMNGKELTSAIYDNIIPYGEGDIVFIVKQDSIYGWLDKSYAYHKGFPDKDSENYITRYKYLSREVTIDKTSKTVTEILDIKHMGFGIVMPSNYLVSSNTFSEIIADISLGDENMMGWGGTQYLKTERSLLNKISDKISALIVSLKTGYVGGREGFYERSYSKIAFKDENNVPIGSHESLSANIDIKKIDSTLLEIKNIFATTNREEYNPLNNASESNLPIYQYFNLSGSVQELKSKRNYSFTEFVKIDSSYLIGNFLVWDSKSNQQVARNFLSNETIKEFRNELLAANGYIFSDKGTSEQFGYFDWYEPRYSKYKDFIDDMTEIDKHNLQFLETIVGTLNAEGVTL